MVALSNLTSQNNDLEISCIAHIHEPAPGSSPNLPSYHRYMDFTESKKFQGDETVLRLTRGASIDSDPYDIVLVRRKGSSHLAGCFLFGSAPSSQSQNAPAAASSSSNPGPRERRLLLQRVYPSSGVVHAHQWYRCLYAALFQGLLLKGWLLPSDLLSTCLLPQIRKAPGTVRSLSLYRCC
jgi:hypothetical protein